MRILPMLGLLVTQHLTRYVCYCACCCHFACASLPRFTRRSRERHTFVRLMALQYLLERITLTRTDKARYHSFREKHEHYISDALEKLNDTQRHRLLHGVRGSVLLQAGGRRRLRGQGTARQLQRQQAQLLDAQQRQQQRQ